MGVLADSNVLLDVITEDPVWYGWSAAQLAGWSARESVAINPLILAEVSVGYRTQQQMDAALSALPVVREALPWDAAFLAGQAHLAYRRAGGTRRSPLPDFYIGAHALVAGHRLLTRDAARYRRYFPKLKLIAP